MRLSVILAALLLLAPPAWAQTGGGTAPISATGGSYSGVNCLVKSANSTQTSCSGVTDNGTVSTSEIVSISNNTNVYQASFINTPSSYALKVCDTTTTTRCAGIGFDASGTILGAYLQGVNVGTSYTPTMLGPSGGLVELGVSGATGTDHEVAMAKTTASGTAPGAGNVKFAAVAGTSGGTCKILIYAGTSTTPTAWIDNVGSGC